MATRVRAWGSCVLSGMLVCALAAGFPGYSAQAEESASQNEFREAHDVGDGGQGIGSSPDEITDETTARTEIDSDSKAPDDVQAAESGALDEADPVGDADALSATKSKPDVSAAPNATAASQASRTAADPVVSIEGSTLYANGVAVCIKKDADGKTYVFDDAGTEKLVSDPVSLSTVYGGSKNAPVDGDASVRIEGVRIGTVYGGGYSDGTAAADVSGSAAVTITGTVDAGSVHGGGYANAIKGDASANVSGAATVAIPAQPSSNHGNLYGGGQAVAQKGFDASATAGSTSLAVTGRTYSAQGGGSASVQSAATGCATADVVGAIDMRLSGVDVREVYGGGNASGGNAHATAASVSVSIDGDEAMWVQGGGDASSGGNADVSGATLVDIENCTNLYGYIFGGGQASVGSSARVASATVRVRDSAYPVDTQFGSYVAGATFAGGYAPGAGANADVSGAVSLSIANCEGGGNIYGGGYTGSGGSARVGDSRVSLGAVSATAYDGETFACLVHAGGETDDPQTSPAEPASAAVTVEGSSIERLAGGSLVGDAIVSTSCESRLTITGTQNRIQELVRFDTVSLSSPLSVDRLTAKAVDAPTVLSVSGIGTGKQVLVCKDASVSPASIVRIGGELDFAIEEADGVKAAVWRMGAPKAAVEVVVPSEPDAPAVTVGNAGEIADKLVTDEDRAAMEAGAQIAFSVRVEPIERLPENVEQAVERSLSEEGRELAFHLDINLVKSVDGSEAAVHSIAQTGEALQFSVEVPDRLASEGREFSVLRFHERDDGSIEVAELSDIDDDPSTVTFETDRFSVYSLVYRDASVGPDNPPASNDDPQDPYPGNQGDDSPGTDGGNPSNPAEKLDTPGAPAKDAAGMPQPQRIVASTIPSTGDAAAPFASLALGVAAMLLAGIGACWLRIRAVRSRF